MELQKICCGLHLRGVCVVTAFVEVVVVIFSTIAVIMYVNLVPPWIIVPFAVLDIFLVAAVVVGAIIQKDLLLWPYVIVKIAVMALSAIAVAVCMIAFAVCHFSIHNGQELVGETPCSFFSILVGAVSLILIGLNIVPTMLVRDFQKKLMDIEEPERKDISYQNV